MVENKIKIGDKSYTLQKASLRQVSKVEKLLGIDFLKDGLSKVDWLKILRDEKKIISVFHGIFVKVDEDILDELTHGGFVEVIACFFMVAQRGNLEYESGLKSFGDTIESARANFLQRDIPSTVLSSKSQTATQ